MIILILTTLIFLSYLIIERIFLERRLKAIALRISVTGTRGKTTLVRMVAAMLRANGWQVLAKTTGSEAKYILPDGSEQDIPRRGLPSILEQKQLLKKAVQLRANCIVAEIMSIHPENHFVESLQLLRPNIVLLTNIRLDHTDAMGQTTHEIARVFCLDLPTGSRLFIPESELRTPIIEISQREGIELMAVSDEPISERWDTKIGLAQSPGHGRHIALVSALGRQLGIDEPIITKGIQHAQPDIGGMKIWKYRPSDSEKTYYLVNAFAANDPLSTREIVEWVKVHLPAAHHNSIGLLNLRADRGDRTLQWIQALRTDPAFDFKQLFLIGSHIKAVKRCIPSAQILAPKQPAALMKTMIDRLTDQSVIFGCGNIAGIGRSLVNYWNQIGVAYGI